MAYDASPTVTNKLGCCGENHFDEIKEEVDMQLKSENTCQKHRCSLECRAGCSAHPNNWYCHQCELEFQLSTERQLREKAESDLQDLGEEHANISSKYISLEREKAMLVDYLERVCDDKCNAEYNPCEARQLLNATSAQSSAWLEAKHMEWIKTLPIVAYADRRPHSSLCWNRGKVPDDHFHALVAIPMSIDEIRRKNPNAATSPERKVD